MQGWGEERRQTNKLQRGIRDTGGGRKRAQRETEDNKKAKEKSNYLREK